MNNKIEIEKFLIDVAKEAMTYENVTDINIGTFKRFVWNILNDSNGSQDCCIFENDKWYICLAESESVKLTAENLSLTIQDGKLIENFAAAVIRGNSSAESLTRWL